MRRALPAPSASSAPSAPSVPSAPSASSAPSAPSAPLLAPFARLAASALAASLALLAATAASAHPVQNRELRDLEHPEPRPCKCRRPEPQYPPLAYEALTRNDLAASVAGHARAHDSRVGACLARARASSTVLTFAFERGTTRPRVTATGSRALAACIAALPWRGFEAPARATTLRFHVSPGPNE